MLRTAGRHDSGRRVSARILRGGEASIRWPATTPAARAVRPSPGCPGRLEALRQDKRLPGADKDVAYITRLFTDEAHLIAGPDITDIRQLAGKRVNFDLEGSGANYTGHLIFERLGIPVEATNVDQLTSYEMLKRGELAATFQMSGKPIPAIANLRGEGLHLVSVPYDPRIADLYLPARFTREDYPQLVQGDDTVETVAVSSILAVYNWPENTERYKKVARFVDAFFSKLPEFQKPPRHLRANA